MLNPTFLENKIKRQINQNGQDFMFMRHGVDEYHQVTDNYVSYFEVRGIFHTTNNYISQNISDGSRITKKPQAMVLTTYDYGLPIQKDDEVEIADKKYVVVDKNNVNSFNVAFDISLELVQWQEQE